MAVRLRKDDRVIVIAGAHKGAVGKVLRLLPDKDRVVVEGVNMVYRHVRKSRRYPQGGRVQKEAPIHISNVQPIDPKTGKGTRVRFTVERDGRGHITRKQRVSTGGTVLGEVTRGESKRGKAGTV
jgi:large subunit ribosomal protein L24